MVHSTRKTTDHVAHVITTPVVITALRIFLAKNMTCNFFFFLGQKTYKIGYDFNVDGSISQRLYPPNTKFPPYFISKNDLVRFIQRRECCKTELCENCKNTYREKGFLYSGCRKCDEDSS